MANAIYPKFKKAGHNGGANVNLITGVVKMVLIDEGLYTYDAAHEFLSDIPSGARIATSGALAGKSLDDTATFKSDNVRWDGVTGASTEAAALFVDTGSAGSSRLIAFYDAGVTGLPFTPAGASYNGIPDSTGWFTL